LADIPGEGSFRIAPVLPLIMSLRYCLRGYMITGNIVFIFGMYGSTR